MTSREMLECRIYVAEDAMYQRSGDLDRHLHELESRLKGLTAEVHRTLCESGQTPLELKTAQIAQAVEAFEASVDLNGIRGEADRITSLKGLIEDYEREIAERADLAGGGPDFPQAVDELAAIA